MRGLWHIPLNGELGVARHSLHKLWKCKGLPIDILLLVLEFAYRAFEDILTSHHAQCDEGYCSPCWHEERILKLAADHRTWRSAPETCRFPCHLTSCGGNVLIIDNILPQITPTQGKYGRMVLSDSWKVYVINKNRSLPTLSSPHLIISFKRVALKRNYWTPPTSRPLTSLIIRSTAQFN